MPFLAPAQAGCPLTKGKKLSTTLLHKQGWVQNGEYIWFHKDSDYCHALYSDGSWGTTNVLRAKLAGEKQKTLKGVTKNV